MNTYATLMDKFWSDGFWLPMNHTWGDMRNVEPTDSLPQFTDLLVPIPLAIFIHLLRLVIERYVWKPLGIHYGLKELRIVHFEKNNLLEKTYKRNKRPDNAVMEKLAITHNLEERYVARWFRKRRNHDKSSALTKFCESGWRLCFYLFAFLYGCVALYDKPWLWDTRECWVGAPRQNVDPMIYWYYMFEIAYYLSAATSIFYDVKRKDFWEMFIHHVATIFLMSFSWVTNFVRVGSLVLVVHDTADYWLEGAKMAKYVNKNKICDCIFGVFTIIWFITRLIILPFRILWPIYFVAWPKYLAVAQKIFCNLLLVLQCLHIFWSKLIVHLIIETFRYPEEKEVRDTRSESEKSEMSESD